VSGIAVAIQRDRPVADEDADDRTQRRLEFQPGADHFQFRRRRFVVS
jgi:hypothetical protein